LERVHPQEQHGAITFCALRGLALNYLPESVVHPMSKQEKQRLSAVLLATEYLFLENIALKLVLEHREVQNWQKLAA
jgi:hypothetical protein